jgi:hypothetical protein
MAEASSSPETVCASSTRSCGSAAARRLAADSRAATWTTALNATAAATKSNSAARFCGDSMVHRWIGGVK